MDGAMTTTTDTLIPLVWLCIAFLIVIVLLGFGTVHLVLRNQDHQEEMVELMREMVREVGDSISDNVTTVTREVSVTLAQSHSGTLGRGDQGEAPEPEVLEAWGMDGLDWAEAAARAEDGQPHPSTGPTPPWATWGQPGEPTTEGEYDLEDSDLIIDPTDATLTEPVTYDNGLRTVGVDRVDKIDLGGERL